VIYGNGGQMLMLLTSGSGMHARRQIVDNCMRRSHIGTGSVCVMNDARWPINAKTAQFALSGSGL